MTHLTQLYDLLTQHGGTLTYNALAGMMGTNVKTVATAVAQARTAKVAYNINKKGASVGGVAQLCPNAVAPVSSRETYQKAAGRAVMALALLAEHPDGLSQADIGTLAGWGHATVTRCMVGLEQTGAVDVAGGTARRPKTYTLPQADSILPPVATVAPHQPLPRAQSHARTTPDLTGDLGAARKLVAKLTSKTPRGLATAGNYKLSRAEELFAELKAGGWV